MSIHMPPPAVDLLAQAIEVTRKHLDQSIPIKQRARNFWAIAVAVRDLGACDVVQHDLVAVARDTGLTTDLGSAGTVNVEHLIRWGLFDRNPFD